MAKRSHEEDPESSEDEQLRELPGGAKWSRGQREPDAKPEPLMVCSDPPTCHIKPRTFYTIESLERHLAKHATRCPVCQLPFPNAHFQNLHIEEHHDPVFQARLARGELVFRCFVEVCRETFPSASKRRRHLVKDHAYPETFRFNIVSNGLKSGTPSLLYREKPQQANVERRKAMQGVEAEGHQEGSSKPTRAQRRAAKEKTSTEPSASDLQARAIEDLFKSVPHDEYLLEPEQEDVGMQDLTTSLANTTLKVPPKIKFGRR